MNTTVKRVIWDMFLVLVAIIITFIVTNSIRRSPPIEQVEITQILDTPEPQIIERTVEVIITKEVVITATPEPATSTPTPTETPAATLGPVSGNASLVCFPGEVSQGELERILAGQAELPSGAREAQILESGYVLMASVPTGGYETCAFSYELNRGGGDSLSLALYGYGAEEPFEAYPLQASSLEPQRVFAFVSHSIIVNPNGRWVGVAKLINPDWGVLLSDNLSIAGNKTAGGDGGGGGGGGGGGYPSYP